MKIDINKINGQDIIDFLNEKSDHPDNEWYHEYNVYPGSFKLKSQKVTHNEYILEFSLDFNNWSTRKRCPYNEIRIRKDVISVSLDEPIEGSGLEDGLDDLLMKEWLPNYSFDTDVVGEFQHLIQKSFDMLSNVRYVDGVGPLEEIIGKLTRAKNLIK